MGNKRSIELMARRFSRRSIWILFPLLIGWPLKGQNIVGFGDNWRVDKTLLPKNFRFMYNSDGENMLIGDADTPEKLYRFVDEAARAGVTSFFMSPNIGMAMNFPTKAGDMSVAKMSDEELPRCRTIPGKPFAI
jgi:hypothetical protein